MSKFETRREFLVNAGKVALGAAALSVVAPVANVVAETAPEYPYAYAKIDPEVAADRAYARFSELGGCCVVGIPGEAFVEFGLYVKAMAGFGMSCSTN